MSGAPGRIDPTLEDLGPELAAQVALLLGDEGGHAAPVSIELQRLRHRSVFRARVAGDGMPRSVVIKRLGTRAAQRNRLVAQRWLPWLGLDGVAPALLATAAGPGVESVWQIYEDVGGATLRAQQTDRECVAAAVDLIAEIHMRAAGHPVVSECRREGDDFGSHFFTSNVRDAVSLLEALRPPVVRPSAEQAALRDRLRQRLERLLDAPPDRSAAIAEAGGPDTLLHGDLWTANVLVLRAGGPLRVRVIDWDHAGAGPVSYDLSCFLSRFAVPERPWIVDRYRSATARAGWRLPPLPALNLLFESAECARYANRIIWPAIALLHGGAPWGFGELAEIEQWFEALKPLLEV
jgi:aminoglycoside phosphotransferase (APT) family kinase protein